MSAAVRAPSKYRRPRPYTLEGWLGLVYDVPRSVFGPAERLASLGPIDEAFLIPSIAPRLAGLLHAWLTPPPSVGPPWTQVPVTLAGQVVGRVTSHRVLDDGTVEVTGFVLDGVILQDTNRAYSLGPSALECDTVKKGDPDVKLAAMDAERDRLIGNMRRNLGLEP